MRKLTSGKGFYFILFGKQCRDEHKEEHQLKDNYGCTVLSNVLRNSQILAHEGVYCKLSGTQECNQESTKPAHEQPQLAFLAYAAPKFTQVFVFV